MQLALSLALTQPQYVGGSAPPEPVGAHATALTSTPTVHYHAGDSAATLSSGRVTAADDLMGLADVTGGSGGNGGPLELTDALGRKFWRFEGSEYLNIAAALEAVSSQALAVFMVGRFHRNRTSNPIFGLGNVALGTQLNTNGVTFQVSGSSNTAPMLRTANRNANSFDTTPENGMAGSQLQVAGFVSRNSGNGGVRFYRNETTVTNGSALTVTSATSASGAGAEIGRYPQAPSTAGNWAEFDLYELVIYKGSAGAVLSNAEADVVAAELVANWEIPALTDTLVVEGDSITQGWTGITSGDCLSMTLTDPGEDGTVPGSWLVVNTGASGNTIANLVARRDTALAWPNFKISGGRSVVAVQIGANNYSGMTAADIYAGICDLIDTTTTGYAQRGWETCCAVNIATANGTNQPKVLDLRTLLRDLTTFRSDCGGLTAQQLRIADLPLITVGGSTRFEDAADAGNLTYYDSDGLHPSETGSYHMGRGGDTLANGYAQRAVATS